MALKNCQQFLNYHLNEAMNGFTIILLESYAMRESKMRLGLVNN
jgi:hypothetical protein